MLCCALPQLVLGAPFLLTFPVSYLRKAFELDRVFFYKWTVNFKVRVFLCFL
jgi:alpha-1,3-mannosyltransferase